MYLVAYATYENYFWGHNCFSITHDLNLKIKLNFIVYSLKNLFILLNFDENPTYNTILHRLLHVNETVFMILKDNMHMYLFMCQ